MSRALPIRCVLSIQLLITLVVLCFAGCQGRAGPAAIEDAPSAQPPLEVSFLPSQGLFAKEGEVSCSVPAGRDHVYDPKTGTFHVHFQSRNFVRSACEVTKSTGRFARPVVFRFTGVPTSYGCLGHPLTLTVAEKRYAMDASMDSEHYWAKEFDKALFRSQREGDAVTVEFTEKGQALLRPGARISLEVDTGW